MSKRLFLKLLVLVPALSLIVFGMRTPSFAHQNGPKPRPRAVLGEDISKSKSQAVNPCAPQHLDGEIPGTVTVRRIPVVTYNVVTLCSFGVAAPILSSHDSRASPALSPRLS